jgi:hypothetical protein
MSDKTPDVQGEWSDIREGFTEHPYTGPLPPRVYRYRSYTVQNWKQRLSSEIGNTEVFLAPLASLNDPEEVFPDVRALGDVDAIRKYWRANSKHFMPSSASQTELDDEITRRTGLLLGDYCGFNDGMYLDYVSKMGHMARVACFTEHELSPLMWAHYALYYDGDLTRVHGGLVLQYTVWPELTLANFRPVIYRQERPVIDIFADEAVSRRAFMQAAFTKGVAWAHEREWRLFGSLEKVPSDGRIDPRRATQRFPAHALTGIYFGLHTPDELCEEVVRLVKLRPVRPRLFEVRRDRHSLRLNRREVEWLDHESRFDLEPFNGRPKRIFL